jgi:hypothetical protein
MSAMVAKVAVVATAAAGLAASFLVPWSPEEPTVPAGALRMPAATRETTVSVSIFPAPGRPESSLVPLERPRPPAAQGPRSPALGPPTPEPNLPESPLVRRVPGARRVPLAPIRPQTDERLLAELGPDRPDDRSRRPLVAE